MIGARARATAGVVVTGPTLALALALATLCALVALPSPSFANGRFPSAGQLVVDPADRRHIVVRATFGLLWSLDAGATWSWLCERAASPDGFQDPEVIVTTDGRIAIGLPDGLAVSDRSGCQWTRAAGLVGDEVIDLVVSGADPAIAYAATVVRVDGAFNGLIAGTTDGVSWAATGALLPNTYPLTIEIASSRRQRLYLGANDGNLETGFIDVSDDGGATWTARDSPGGVDAIYVSAVDPDDADRVYARSYSPQSNLYVSEDGARTWISIATSPVPLLGFALSPDGRRIAAGGRDGLMILARTDDVTGSSYTVTATNPLPVGCLTWTADGLFACADEATAGFSIGVSIDGGRTFAPLLHLADLTPAVCAGGTAAAAACAVDWCATATAIGAVCTTTAVDAAADTSDAGNGGGRPPAPAATGCACDATGGASPPPVVVLAMVMILAAAWGCPRARRQRAATPTPSALAPRSPLTSLRSTNDVKAKSPEDSHRRAAGRRSRVDEVVLTKSC